MSTPIDAATTESPQESPENTAALEAEVPAENGIAQEPERNTIAEWAVTILLLLFGTTVLVQAFVIPTGSMEGTLKVGDHLLVDKLAYAPPGPVSQYFLPYSHVNRGDIIVFRWPTDIKMTFVKRVIGIPGDRIRIENQQVYRNGKPIAEPYKNHTKGDFDSYRDTFPSEPNTTLDDGAKVMLRDHVLGDEVVVPENMYFALGDNRDNSSDSRYWGFVPRENIIGKPLIVYWSYDAQSAELQNSTPTLSHLKDLGKNFFTKTRWRRTFLLIHGQPFQE